MKDAGFGVPDPVIGRFTSSYGPNPEGGLRVIDGPETSRYRKHPTMLPAERPIGRARFALTGDRRLSRCTSFLACITSHGFLRQSEAAQHLLVQRKTSILW